MALVFPGEQLKWFEADLAAANASRHLRPWIFVGGHRPVFDAAGLASQCEMTRARHECDGLTAGEDIRTDTFGSLADAIEDLMNAYKVASADVVLIGSGDHHL